MKLKIQNQLFDYVIKNQKKLLDFWNHGTDWTRTKVNKHLDSLKRIK